MADLTGAVHGWLAALSTLVAGRMSVEEIRLRLSSYVPLLAEEFPDERYFTSRSLRHVARHSKWFPSYGELCDLLTAAWKDSIPPTPAITTIARPRDYPIEPAPEWCFDKTTRHGRSNDEWIPPVDNQSGAPRALGSIIIVERGSSE